MDSVASETDTVDWVRLPQRFPVRIQVDKSAKMERDYLRRQESQQDPCPSAARMGPLIM